MSKEPVPTALLNEAVRVFGNEEKARRWLHRPHSLLGNRPPVQVAQAQGGRERVRALLGRIEHGIAE